MKYRYACNVKRRDKTYHNLLFIPETQEGTCEFVDYFYIPRFKSPVFIHHYIDQKELV